MQSPPRICLVSPSHVAANPRLVKEANALHEAGYKVHVVAGWYYPPLDPYDREIYEAAPWSRSLVYHLTGPRVMFAKLRRDIARRQLLNTVDPSLGLALRSNHTAIGLLTRAARKVDADLYIGHNLAGLAAAASAAQRRGAAYGFDAEDFHSAETERLATGGPETAAIRKIESTFLPGCAHFTAASRLIGSAYADTYGLAAPTTVLNVFPLSEAPAGLQPGLQGEKSPRLYWFSQTIGPGRGLEQLVAALGKMRVECELHLRGIPCGDFPDRLRRLARQSSYAGRIHFQVTASANEMARLASGYDLGLSLEQSWPTNRDLCLTNKIFTYLLAGIPVGLTPTRAQREIASELGEAAVPIDLEHPIQAAAALDAFFENPVRQAAARNAAWQLAQSRFNWDSEKSIFLDSISAALSGRKRPTAP